MVLGPPLLIQLPVNATEKVADNVPNTSVPATPTGYPNGVLGSWLQTGPALVAGHRESEPADGRLLPLSLCFSNNEYTNTLSLLKIVLKLQ